MSRPLVLRRTLTTLAFLVRLNDAGETAMMGDTDRKLEPHIQELCRSAQEELRQLMRDRAQVVKHSSSSRMLSPNNSANPPVCRDILLTEKRPLTANEVYRLVRQRFPMLLAEHKEPVSSVTTVLNRLVKYGEAESFFVGKRRAWQKVGGYGRLSHLW